MFELTINNQVYGFNFGMGFMREINRTLSQPVDGVPGAKQNIGLRYKIAGIMDGDIEALEDVLEAANKGCEPRLTRAVLDAHIDDANTDIDRLFEDVLDFLANANATKKTVAMLKEALEKEKAKNNEK